MKKVLVVGASGQLGTRVFEKLTELNQYAIRIFVREDSVYSHLAPANHEVVIGDLRDRDSIDRAVNGVDIIIATANTAAPRKKEDTFKAVDTQGYRDLIDAAKKHGVGHFIYTSILPGRGHIPLNASKAQTEAYLIASGVPYTIFQPAAFMDVYFAFMGSTIPLKNEVAATVNRNFPFMQNFFKSVKDNIDNGMIGIIGEGTVRQNYIAIDNVADFLVKAIDNPVTINTTHLLGGPEALSALEVKAIFEKALGRPLGIKKTPALVMKLMGSIFSWINPTISNIFKLNHMGATVPGLADCRELADKLGIHLISAEEYLRTKLKE